MMVISKGLFLIWNMESGWTAKWIPDIEVQPEFIFQIASRSI